MAKIEGWHREDIKAALRKQYGSLSSLALQWGYTPTALTNVLQRGTASIRLEMLIANAIGEAPHTLWPDRWGADGIPRSRGTERTRSRKSTKTNLEMTEAA